MITGNGVGMDDGAIGNFQWGTALPVENKLCIILERSEYMFVLLNKAFKTL